MPGRASRRIVGAGPRARTPSRERHAAEPDRGAPRDASAFIVTLPVGTHRVGTHAIDTRRHGGAWLYHSTPLPRRPPLSTSE